MWFFYWSPRPPVLFPCTKTKASIFFFATVLRFVTRINSYLLILIWLILVFGFSSSWHTWKNSHRNENHGKTHSFISLLFAASKSTRCIYWAMYDLAAKMSPNIHEREDGGGGDFFLPPLSLPPSPVHPFASLPQTEWECCSIIAKVCKASAFPLDATSKTFPSPWTALLLAMVIFKMTIFLIDKNAVPSRERGSSSSRFNWLLCIFRLLLLLIGFTFRLLVENQFTGIEWIQ